MLVRRRGWRGTTGTNDAATGSERSCNNSTSNSTKKTSTRMWEDVTVVIFLRQYMQCRYCSRCKGVVMPMVERPPPSSQAAANQAIVDAFGVLGRRCRESRLVRPIRVSPESGNL